MEHGGNRRSQAGIDPSLDPAKFESCYDARAHQKRIEANFAEGERRKIGATPTFFVADRAYANALSYDQLKAIVDSAAKK